MKQLLPLLFFVFCLTGFAQTKVILDADFDSDIDDVGALAMLLNLHKCGTINLAGVAVTSDDPFAPVCVEAMLAWYGENDIPVAFLQEQEKLVNHSRYTRQMAEEFSTSQKKSSEFPDVVTLYREVLSRSANSSVVIVTIGHLSSLQKLLMSESDHHSPLSGKELARQKTARWLCMGGLFPEGKEANFYRPDPASTGYCLANWTNEVVFCGWEVGNIIITGDAYLKEHANRASPLYRGYELYNNFHGRASWDQIAVLLLTEQGRGFFDVCRSGRCEVDETGYNRWVKGAIANHGYLVLKNEATADSIARFTDNLMWGNPKTLKAVCGE